LASFSIIVNFTFIALLFTPYDEARMIFHIWYPWSILLPTLFGTVKPLIDSYKNEGFLVTRNRKTSDSCAIQKLEQQHTLDHFLRYNQETYGYDYLFKFASRMDAMDRGPINVYQNLLIYIRDYLELLDKVGVEKIIRGRTEFAPGEKSLARTEKQKIM
jgi:hypothetical protein